MRGARVAEMDPAARERQNERARKYRAKIRAMHADGTLARPVSKTCAICNEDKPADDFAKCSNVRDGLYAYCRPCDAVRQREQVRQVIEADPEGWKTRRAAASRKYNHNLSDADFRLLAEAQEFCCAICGEATNLCVDHDHATGAVRGLLCQNCNSGIGMLKDDPARLAAALAYLLGGERKCA